MSKSVSYKYNNHEYAPGISTYGVNGKDGDSGLSGTTLFICRHDVSEQSGTALFGYAVVNNLDTSKNEDVKLQRAYKNGDSFLMQSSGQIYNLTDIDGLKSDSVGNILTPETLTTKYMTLVGQIQMTSIDTGFTENRGRLVLDTEAYRGFIINTSNTDTDSVQNIKAPLTVISTTSDNNNDIYFISMNGINQQSNTELKIYYDSDNKCYHIDSDSPVMIDADLKVKYNTSEDYDGYSRVVTATDKQDMSLSSTYAVCQKLRYRLSAERKTGDAGTYTEFRLVFDNIPEYCNMVNVSVHVALIDKAGAKKIKDAWFSPVAISYGSYLSSEYVFETDEVNPSNLSAVVSIISTVECFIQGEIVK